MLFLGFMVGHVGLGADSYKRVLAWGLGLSGFDLELLVYFERTISLRFGYG